MASPISRAEPEGRLALRDGPGQVGDAASEPSAIEDSGVGPLDVLRGQRPQLHPPDAGAGDVLEIGAVAADRAWRTTAVGAATHLSR